MNFENRTNSEKISIAMRRAEKLFSVSSPMMLEIMRKNDFEYDSGSGTEVYEKLLSYDYLIPVFTYRPLNPFTRAIGYSDGKSIHVNIRKLSGMRMENLIGNICHEAAHCAGFHHGSNWPSQHKNNHSVPYFISSNIEKWL